MVRNEAWNSSSDRSQTDGLVTAWASCRRESGLCRAAAPPTAAATASSQQRASGGRRMLRTPQVGVRMRIQGRWGRAAGGQLWWVVTRAGAALELQRLVRVDWDRLARVNTSAAGAGTDQLAAPTGSAGAAVAARFAIRCFRQVSERSLYPPSAAEAQRASPFALQLGCRGRRRSGGPGPAPWALGAHSFCIRCSSLYCKSTMRCKFVWDGG